MPELPACFQDYNHFGHSLKARSVLSGLIDSLQKPDNNRKFITQNTIGDAQSTTYNPLAPADLRPLLTLYIYYSFLDVTTLTI